jgi:hypothetical protein
MFWRIAGGRIDVDAELFISAKTSHTISKGWHMANILWTIIVILFVLWLIGFIGHIGGSLINILIVIVIIGVIYNLVTGRRSV